MLVFEACEKEKKCVCVCVCVRERDGVSVCKTEIVGVCLRER